MEKVRRLYVEKKPGADSEAKGVASEIRNGLHIKALENVRLVVRYDVAGLSDEAYARAKQIVFMEAPVDTCYEEEFDFSGAAFVLAVELLPGQYDQRADSAAQCIQIAVGGEKPLVRCAKVMLFYGSFSPEEEAAIRKYLVNPVDSREASLEKYATLDLPLTVPETVPTIEGFIRMGEAELQQLHASMGLAMDRADLAFCQAYFRDEEGRDPTQTEIRMIDTYWSDHCRHTTFLTQFQNVEIQDPVIRAAYEDYLAARARLGRGKDKPACLMDLATIAAKDMRKRGLLANLDVSEEINACSIVVPVTVDGQTENYLIQFKNETHNHPTEIEPFGGAATCLGGAIRDPLSGRAYVYQAMRITGCGNPLTPFKDTLPGKLPQRKLTQTAAAGYSAYGNQIGLATGMVHEVYHPGYVAKRMELGGVIGAVPQRNVRREEPAPGDYVVLLGGRTGRDGCGGATGSSKAHTETSIETCGAEVQKGNPPEERKIQRLFRNPDVARRIKRCNDFGAGGVSVAIGELADGLAIDLDRVPKKYESLDGTELAISESQERMAVVIEPAELQTFLDLCAAENIEATHVATVTRVPELVMTWRGQQVCHIKRSFLNTNGAPKATDLFVPAVEPQDLFHSVPLPGQDLKADWLALLADLNICSQQGLSERFDASIGGGSVLMPFGGKRQLTPTEAMVAKVPVAGETDDATIMAHGYDPMLSSKSPFHGAVYAVVDSITRLVAAGGNYRDAYLTLQEFFERPGTDPSRWGKPLAALLGAYYAQQQLNIAAIGGKDSMSGSFNDLDVPPTLVSIAVSPTLASRTPSPEFKKPGSGIWLAAAGRELLPDFAALTARFSAVHAAIRDGRALAVHTVGMGGVAEALTKMTFGNCIGAKLSVLPEQPFACGYGGFVIESDADLSAFAVRIGETVPGGGVQAPGLSLSDEELRGAWLHTLEPVFPRFAASPEGRPLDARDTAGSPAPKPRLSHPQPRVFIPVFPGTNCEYDSVRAFRRAGAVADTAVFCNRSSAEIEDSVHRFAQAVRASQIVMIPGGFSAGDEPDGSGKFIAAVFRHPELMDAVEDLLTNRDGLMLGICNGFQALIKLGLLPGGHIVELTDNAPTLTFNTIGRHISRMVYTKVCSTRSPWLSAAAVGDIHAVAVSHGEGRFIADDATIRALIANGQVATQYVDEQGAPTYDAQHNVNGSCHAIEGITSPDGRVLGKMGHSERAGGDIFKNIQGNTDQGIFRSGVAYFQ